MDGSDSQRQRDRKCPIVADRGSMKILWSTVSLFAGLRRVLVSPDPSALQNHPYVLSSASPRRAGHSVCADIRSPRRLGRVVVD